MDPWPNLPVKAVEILEEEGLRKLPGAIRPKVEEQNCIAVANSLFVRLGKDQRRHEFIRLAGQIIPAECHRRRVTANLTAPENDRVPGQFRPIPASITIHRKIAADNRKD